METWQELRRSIARTSLREILLWKRHLGILTSDAFLASYPRSGSNWVKFLLLESILDRPLDFPQSDFLMPYVGNHHNAVPLLRNGGRLIKTHERYHSVYPKAIYLTRDPRDVVISEYRLRFNLGQYTGSIDDFIEEFLDKGVSGLGNWKEHVTSWLEAPKSHILVIRFTDLKKDPEKYIPYMLNFLGIAIQPDAIQRAIANNTIGRMKEKEAQIRKKKQPKWVYMEKSAKPSKFHKSGYPTRLDW